MIYGTNRICTNTLRWTAPDGKPPRDRETEYIRDHGFGHEEWNFNPHLSADGVLRGYCYYVPGPELAGERFSFLFLVYRQQQWHAVGLWKEARYCTDLPAQNDRILRTKVGHLKLVDERGLLGPKCAGKSKQDLLDLLRKTDEFNCWGVATENIVALKRPVRLPKRLYQSKNYRFVKPKFIGQEQFEEICAYMEADLHSLDVADEEPSFPEGGSVERLHRERERSSGVVKLAKENFLRRHGRLFCEACGFDFEREYGEAGSGFIEAHHKKALSSLRRGDKTKASELTMLCSNCHRVVHRVRPWMSLPQLRRLVLGGA